MSIDKNKLLIRRYIEEVINTGNVDEIEKFISPDYVEVQEGTRHPIGIEGRNRIFLVFARPIPIFSLPLSSK